MPYIRALPQLTAVLLLVLVEPRATSTAPRSVRHATQLLEKWQRRLQADPAAPHSGASAAVSISNVNVFVKEPKPCPEGCDELGNCNHETGKCECPWGRTGARCEVDQLSHCYVSDGNAIPSCGLYVPKNCECYRQCFDLYCHPQPGYLYHQDYCTHELMQKLGEGRCFLYQDRPLTQQLSIIHDPNLTDSPKLDWYKLQAEPPSHWQDGKPKTPLEDKMKYMCWNGWSTWDHPVHAVPLSQCKDSCHHRGSCVNEAGRLRCMCRKGFKGDACDEDDSEGACWFAPNCNGHGKCKSGFCHCDKGWWGLGCSRSSAYALAPASRAVPSRTRLRIYMYDLPATIVFAGEFDDGAMTRDEMYAAYEHFLLYFLDDWTVRTENPHEANLFYIPALAFFYVGNVRNPTPHMARVVEYISQEFPFWNRTQGKDHFFFLTGDQGACMLSSLRNNDLLVHNPIKVVHFGLSGKGIEWRYQIDPDYGCLRPERDVVVPPVADYKFFKDNKTQELYQHVLSNNGDDGQNRTWLFFFAGGVVMNDKHVSGNARQSLLRFLKDKNCPDVLVKEGRVDNYEQMFLTSKFCIAPYGYGWGLRLAIAVVHGCIPVIIQDHVWQPFEELLPYHEFSVRLQVKDVPKIMDILRAYSREELNAMRLALAQHWSAFMWRQMSGGRAYNYTIAALRKRMHNHVSEYYR